MSARSELISAANSRYFNESRRTSYGEIFNSYVQSKYGVHHSQQPLRFEDFDYDRGDRLRDLGNDVHPLWHMAYTHAYIITPMIKEEIEHGSPDLFTPKSVRSLRLAAATHDIGECTHPCLVDDDVVLETPGDRHVKLATVQDRVNEASIRKHIYSDLNFKDEFEVDTEHLEIISDPKNRDHSDNRIFVAGERTGYFITALKAGNIALSNIDQFDTSHRVRQSAKFACEVAFAWVHELSRDDQLVFARRTVFQAERDLNLIETILKPNLG